MNKGKVLIVLACLICAFLAFFYFLTRPVHFTAQGIFKGHGSGGGNRIFKALEFLGGDESYVHAEDPRTFLRSYPVIEGMVKALNLQATVTEPGMPGRLREVWYTLKTAYSYKRLKKERPPSQILGGGIYVPDRQIVPDFKRSIACSALDFPGEISSSLSIHFLSDFAFKVKEGSRTLGTGMLDLPFVWEKGSFTLSGAAFKGKKVGIHFIPLPQAIQSLQNSILLARDKENPALIHVRYIHRDRHLASRIVNETMEQFQKYLTQEGKKKITKQLTYLRVRQEESMEQLETILEKQKAYLESHLDAGIILSLENELEFMAQTQAEKKQKLLEIQSEMEYLAGKSLPFPELLDAINHQSPPQATHALSVESAHEMIRHHQGELDRLYLDMDRYDYCQTKLAQPDFDCSSLAKILNDPSLHTRFDKMHTLHHRLIDSKNWSLKEREQLKTELETEKAFLTEYTSLLKDGAELHAQAIQKRIAAIHKDLLFLLADRHAQELGTLSALAEQAKHFPEKWLNEQKIDLTSKMHKEIMESITKMIEAKNIGYNLDYLLAQVLKQAYSPILPDPPRLLLGTCLGGFAGALCAFLALLFAGVWKGPTASFHNLTSLDKNVIPENDTIPLLGLELTQSGPVILLAARHQLSFAAPLIDWFKKKGDKVCVIDLTSAVKPSCMEGRDLACLASHSFHAELAAYRKEYDRIIILATGPVHGFSIQALLKCTDAIVYGSVGEPLESLASLPSQTYFVIQKQETAPYTEFMLPLSALAPMLEQLLLKMKYSSFSAVKTVWEQAFPLKKP